MRSQSVHPTKLLICQQFPPGKDRHFIRTNSTNTQIYVTLICLVKQVSVFQNDLLKNNETSGNLITNKNMFHILQ